MTSTQAKECIEGYQSGTKPGAKSGGGRGEASMNTIVEMLREAAVRFTLSEAEGLRTVSNGSLIIPEHEDQEA